MRSTPRQPNSAQPAAIVIAHRLSTVVESALVLVLAAGELVECGPPGRLTAAAGHHAILAGAPPS
jgi:ABC-type transport system involved in Fe-S cluster assembly fused permease/ATPase subunit